MNNEPMIIVCIPAYNEEKSISELVLKARQFAHQVIVVDDGSTDETARLAEAAGALVIRHKGNRGPGQATKSGLEEAMRRGAQVVVTLDGDGQHDPNGIPQILAPALSGKADLVIGSRFLANHDSMPRYRWFGIKVISWLYNLGAKARVVDTQSCFRAYGERALRSLDITERGFGFSVELLVQARKRGLTISEVPTPCIYNLASHSRDPLTHGIGVALSVIKHRFRDLLHGLA